jgi:oleate hydratase
VFTVKMSVRTGMEAVYKFTGPERDMLEVYPSRYDIRYMVERMKQLKGIEYPFTADDLPHINPLKINELKEKVLAVVNSIPPYYQRYLGRDQTVPLKKSVLNTEAPKAKQLAGDRTRLRLQNASLQS